MLWITGRSTICFGILITWKDCCSLDKYLHNFLFFVQVFGNGFPNMSQSATECWLFHINIRWHLNCFFFTKRKSDSSTNTNKKKNQSTDLNVSLTYWIKLFWSLSWPLIYKNSGYFSKHLRKDKSFTEPHHGSVSELTHWNIYWWENAMTELIAQLVSYQSLTNY